MSMTSLFASARESMFVPFKRETGLESGSSLRAAVERVNSSILKELVMTDSISPPDRATDGGKIRYVSCDRLIGEAIRRIANEESVSKLFD